MAWKKSHSRPRRHRSHSFAFAPAEVVSDFHNEGHHIQVKKVGNGYVGYIDGIPKKTVGRESDVRELEESLAYR